MANELNRRAALAAIGTAGALAAVPATAIATSPAEPELDPYAEGHDDGHAVAMEAFALAWLKRWTDKGGNVFINADGKLWVGQPTYRFSATYQDDQALIAGLDLPESVRRDRHSFLSNFYDGKMRELVDLLDAVPGGREAVRAIVEIAPDFGCPRKAEG